MSITDMAMGRVFKEPEQGAINSIDFHRTQDFLVAGHQRGFISVYSTHEGRKLATLDCTKYGVSHVRYTHHPKCVVHASTKENVSNSVENHALRYLSHHDNRYLRFFKGHTQRVTSLSMSPKSDHFLSTSTEKKMLMWDLRTCQAQAALETPGQPFAVMDEEGLVFAVACTAGIVSMFDVRQYEGGPFLSFPLPLEAYGVNELAPIACMKFSSNQQHLLAVVEGHVFVMDTFDGREVVTWRTDVKEGGPAMEASFSADGQYVISGKADRRIHVWKPPPVAPEGQPAPPLTQEHLQPINAWTPHPCMPTCAKFSPIRKMAVTACHALVMWLPRD